MNKLYKALPIEHYREVVYPSTYIYIYMNIFMTFKMLC